MSFFFLFCVLNFDFPQAASGVTFKPKGQVVNIDAGDENDALAVVEYIDDIYKFYKLTEVIRVFSNHQLKV